MSAVTFTANCGHLETSSVGDPTSSRLSARRAYWRRTACRTCRGLNHPTLIPATAQCGHGVTAFASPKSIYPMSAQAARARYYWRNHTCPTCRAANDPL